MERLETKGIGAPMAAPKGARSASVGAGTGAGATVEDLGKIGEFVAAVAVVISLIYLAVQISQNTTSLRLSNYLASESLATESARLIGQMP